MSYNDEIRETVKQLKEQPNMDCLWAMILSHQGEPFYTVKGLQFSYSIRGGEIFIDRKEKTITKSTVEIAYKKVLALGGDVKGPKKLGVFGASYLYPMFVQIGLINGPTARLKLD